jgi:hypothetical protein
VCEESVVGRYERTIEHPMVEPEGSRSAIIDLDEGDGAESVEFVVDDAPEETRISGDRCVKRRSTTEKPFFPAGVISSKKLVDEFHQQAKVLKLKIFHPEPALVFGSLDYVPSNQAFGPVATVLSGPEESTTSLVNGFDDRLRHIERGHVMQRKSAEN